MRSDDARIADAVSIYSHIFIFSARLAKTHLIEINPKYSHPTGLMDSEGRPRLPTACSIDKDGSVIRFPDRIGVHGSSEASIRCKFHSGVVGKNKVCFNPTNVLDAYYELT